MNKEEARELLEQHGFDVVAEEPLPNGYGVQLKTSQGPMLIVYKSGKCVPGGRNQQLIKAILDGAVAPAAPVPQPSTGMTRFLLFMDATPMRGIQ
jgi:predicted nucleotide-binding protein